jgi:hypothetical protein
MHDQADKRLRLVARQCHERAGVIEQRLFDKNLKVIEEKRHLADGSDEGGYYSAGYLQALKDVRVLIADGTFPETVRLK